MQKIIILGLTMLILAFEGTVPVSACSGGANWETFFSSLTQESDAIVVGQYAQLDDAEANGIFQVETYLSGYGAEYLLIQASNFKGIENRLYVNRSYPCGIHNPIKVSTSGKYVYFLKRDNNGIYTIRHHRFFLNAESTTSVWNSDREETKLSVLEFSMLVTQEVGVAPRIPNPDAPYPRTNPILISTINDEYFILPVDTEEVITISSEEVFDTYPIQHECSTPPCTVHSPNGLDKIYLRSSERDFQPINFYYPYVEQNMIGERIVFSASSETFALWHNNQIQLYILWYPKLGYADSPLTNYFSSEMINAIPAGDSFQYPVVWSPDGRTMAFSTDEGLWLWDVFTTDYPPQLLIPTDSAVPTARYFSPLGRYIAVTMGDKHYTIDLVTKRELPDGYISPNDRILLVFDTSADEPTGLDMMYLAPQSESVEYYSELKYLAVQWIDEASFVASVAGDEYLNFKSEPYTDSSGELVYESVPYVVEEAFYDVMVYRTSRFFSYYNSVPYPIGYIQMKDFTYTSGSGLIKISVDGYHLQIDGSQFISFASTLDAPIRDVVWLPLGFYFERGR